MLIFHLLHHKFLNMKLQSSHPEVLLLQTALQLLFFNLELELLLLQLFLMKLRFIKYNLIKLRIFIINKLLVLSLNPFHFHLLDLMLYGHQQEMLLGLGSRVFDELLLVKG